MVSLATHRREREPERADQSLERLASRRVLVSTPSIARVSRFDGRTRVVAVRDKDGWHRCSRMRWSPATIERLRGDVREVLLVRGFRRARVPLSWIPVEQGS